MNQTPMPQQLQINLPQLLCAIVQHMHDRAVITKEDGTTEEYPTIPIEVDEEGRVTACAIPMGFVLEAISNPQNITVEVQQHNVDPRLEAMRVVLKFPPAPPAAPRIIQAVNGQALKQAVSASMKRVK